MKLNFAEITRKELVMLFFTAITILLIFITLEVRTKNYLKISFLDVGQGDSILFQTPNGGKILIDGGKDKLVLNRLGQEFATIENNIDLVIATHDDADHIAGLISVLEKYKVNALLYSLPNSESLLSKELVSLVNKKNVKLIQVTKPMIVNTSDGLIIKILFPVKNMTGAESNEASIVTQFIYGNIKILLSGDLPIAGEEFLIDRYGDSLKSNILKLGHHGSDTSTSADFLQKVSPELVVVSSGKNNSFGHPHRIVTDLVNKFGVEIFRTDSSGTILFFTNGINIWSKE